MIEREKLYYTDKKRINRFPQACQMHEAMVKLLEEQQSLLLEEDLKTIKREIKRYIERESMMVRLTRELSEKVRDPRLKLILMVIHEDEVRHHRLLRAIEKNIVEMGTMIEEQYWNLVWRDGP